MSEREDCPSGYNSPYKVPGHNSLTGMLGLAQRREFALDQVWVGAALLANGAGGPVAADESEVVAKRQELRLDRLDEGAVTGLRQPLGAADRAAEQHVAHQREALRRVDVGDRPW